MATSARTCVNHPAEQTRVSCSACGDPICPRCMRSSAVGQKCPDCARVPRSARALGRPVHYVRALGAGLPLAIAGGIALMQVIAMIRFGTLILSALLGYLIGRVVRWGAAGQTQQPFTWLAAGCAVLGIAVGITLGFGLPVPPLPQGVWLLLGYVAAGYFAVRGVRG